MDTTNLILGGTGALAALAVFGQYWLRRISRNVVEGVKDRAEINVLDIAMKDNERLRSESAANYKDQRELGRLTALVVSMADQIKALTAQIENNERRAKTERESATTERESATTERESAATERESTHTERDRLKTMVLKNTGIGQATLDEAVDAKKVASDAYKEIKDGTKE